VTAGNSLAGEPERMTGMIRIVETVGILLAVPGMIYLQYRRAKWASDLKDQKADLTTLFGGEK
jgi:hypothetical protein